MSKSVLKTASGNLQPGQKTYKNLRESYQKSKCPGSLAESYQQRVLLQERQEAIHAAVLILEAAGDGKKATEALKKFNALNKAAQRDSKNLRPLIEALTKASSEVKDFMGESGFGALFKMGARALAKKFGVKDADSNPLLKSLTLLNTLETGFKDLEETVGTVLVDYEIEDDKSIAEATSSEGDVEAAAERSGISKGKDNKDLANVKKLLIKSFKPEPGGAFAKIMSLFASKGGPPYLEDLTEFVNGLVSVKGSVLKELITAASSGTSSEDAKAMAVQIVQASSGTGKGSGEEAAIPQKTSTPQVVTGIEQLAQAQAAGTAGDDEKKQASAAETAQKDPKSVAKELVDDIVQKTNLGADKVGAILTALIKAKKLKTTFSLATESRLVASNVGTLSFRDVLRARQLYMESGGSSRKWIQFLVEDADTAFAAAEKLLSSIEKKDDGMNVFSTELATQLGLKRDEIQRSFEKDNGEQQLAKIMDKHLPEVEKAAKKAGVNIPKIEGEEGKAVDPKRKALGDEIAKTLGGKDITPQDIISVLDALPKYFMVESLKRNKVSLLTSQV